MFGPSSKFADFLVVEEISFMIIESRVWVTDGL